MTSENVDDRLSSLPEEIISQILSSMPTKFAMRTSILSKRWRCSWMFVANLNFEDNYSNQTIMVDVDSFTTFVDHVLKFCKTSHVKLFRLHIPFLKVHKSSVSRWIDEAVRLNVRELDIHVNMSGLPLSLFTCKTLTKLRLNRIPYDGNDPEFPTYLTCLKTLDITLDIVSYEISRLNVFIKEGCPVLESLSLKVSQQGDCVFNIPTLKRLELTLQKRHSLSLINSSSLISKVAFNLPNLECLFVDGVLCSFFEMEDVSSLVEATFSFRDDNKVDCIWARLLQGVSGVKSLSVQTVGLYIDFNTQFTSPLPIFPNLRQLELKGFWHPRSIIRFLEDSPELKHLYVEKLEDCWWTKPKRVPACMLTKLTTIKLADCNGEKWNIEFLEYMLGNAKVLKTVKVTRKYSRNIEKEMRLCEKLFSLPRASSVCEILR